MVAVAVSSQDIIERLEDIYQQAKRAKTAFKKCESARDNLTSFDPGSSGFERFESAVNTFMDIANSVKASIELLRNSPFFDSPAFKNSSSSLDLFNSFKDHGEASQQFGKDLNNYYLEPSVENWNQASMSFFDLVGSVGKVALTAGVMLNNPAMMVLGTAICAIGFFGGDGFKDFMDDLSRYFDEGMSIISPIVLDLDGNGIETVSVSNGVPFDYAGDGLAEQTGWIGGQDGLLVLDRDNNGKIDNGGELFGNYTRLKSGDRASNGFEALAELDLNLDGLINAEDECFETLKIWRDLNHNGESDEGELLSLSDAGVQSISTRYRESEFVDVNGNEHRQIGSFTALNGEVLNATDVWFINDPRATIPNERILVSMEISKLPEIMGSGMVHGLHQAMARDDSNRLFSLVSDYVAEIDSDIRVKLIDEIIFEWTGVAHYEPDSRGPNIDDGRKIYALEALLGDQFLQGGSSPNPKPDAGAHLSYLYSQLAHYIEGSLLAQSHFKDLVEGIDFNFNNDHTFDIDVATVTDALYKEYTESPSTWPVYLRDFYKVLEAVDISSQRISLAIQSKASDYEGEFSRVLTYLDLNPVIGSATADFLQGTVEGDYISGFEGNDTLFGGTGDDTLDGGAGNDTLNGGMGSDTYKFGRGSGNDIIAGDYENRANADRVLLDTDITVTDVTLARIGTDNDLLLTLADSDSTLRLENYFILDGYSPAAVEEIHFANGMIWDQEMVKVMILQPTSGDDLIIGYRSDDTLDGAAGDDTLKGGGGSDTYKFGRASGNDTIEESHDLTVHTDKVLLGAGITTADVTIARIGSSNDLRLTFANSDSTLVIKNQFARDGYSSISVEEIHFADGSIWDRDLFRAVVMQATSGNDLLVGFSSDDVMDGGSGNDVLKGKGGSDTYKFGRNSGQDTIDETFGHTFEDAFEPADTDRVLLDADLSTTDVAVSRIGESNDLLLTLSDSDSTLRIIDYFSQNFVPAQGLVEEIHFSDGTIWSHEFIKAMLIQPTSGDDLIIGYEGDDVLDGGAGDDTLKGGSGSDTYIFGRNSDNDIIEDGLGSLEHTDIVLLGDGISTADVTVSRIENSEDLLLTVVGADSTLRILGYFTMDGYGPNAIEEIHFSDGAIWDREVVKKMVMQPTSGDDFIIGYATDDVLDGGAGNDELKGGMGSDTYIYGRNYGNDIIEEFYDVAAHTDRVLLDADISAADVMVSRFGDELDDLKLTLVGSDGTLRIDQYFSQHGEFGYSVEEIHFADGTIWGRDMVKELALRPTSGDDVIIGYNSDDVLDGGAGNDVLKGGSGSDTYKFGRNSDNDVIEEAYDFRPNTDRVLLDAEITMSDVSFSRIDTGFDLQLNLADSDSTLIIKNYFFQDGNSPMVVEEFHFTDGTIWDRDVVKTMALASTSGDDVIIGYASDDVLDGGEGNDVLRGGNGSDTYIFGRHSGKDTIEEGYDFNENTDKVLLDTDISTSDVSVERIDGSEDLLLVLNNSESELRIINYFFQDGASPLALEEIHFSDGTIWDYSAVKGMADQGRVAGIESSGLTHTVDSLEPSTAIWSSDSIAVESEQVGIDLSDALLF